MSYYQDAKEAYDDILDDGALMRFRRVTADRDDITGEIVTAVIADQSIPTVVLPDQAVMSDGVQAGSLVSQKTRKGIAAAFGAKFIPQAGDIMTFAGEDWTVIGCSPLNPDGKLDIIFEFGIQK